MKKYLLVTFIVIIGIGFINCDGLRDKTNSRSPSPTDTDPDSSSSALIGGDCCTMDKTRIICVKNQDSDQFTGKNLDIALAYIHNKLQDTNLVTTTASYQFLSYGNKAILPACMKKFHMKGVYSFFPPKGEACHSPADDREKCHKVKEQWVKNQEINNRIKCFPISEPKGTNPESSINPYICLDGKETF